MSEDIFKRLNDFKEYARATNKIHDLDFYEEIEKELNRRQARIDALMLEFCPEEMTNVQRAALARNQAIAGAHAFAERIKEANEFYK